MYRGDSLKTFLPAAPATVKTLEDLRHYGSAHKEVVGKFATTESVLVKAVNAFEEENVSDDDWKYEFNQYHYRGIWDFDSDRPKLGFFGCSFTFGEGIKSEDTFVELSSEHLMMNPFNFGIGGSSVERVARTFAAANNVIDLDYAVITLPAWYRQLHIDINDYGKIINLIPGYPHNGFKKLNQIFDIVDDDYYINRAVSSINWIYDNAKAHNVKVLFSSWDHPCNELCELMYPDNTLKPFPNIDDKCARDKMHPGPKSQYAHAEQIVKGFHDRTWV
jgi:hypothetical protein